MTAAPPAVRVDSEVGWLGEIPAHWDVARLKYVARLGTGHTPSRQHPEYWAGCAIPWVTLADVWQLRDEREMTITETDEKISDLGLANSSAVLHPAGTVILSRTASVGFSAILGVDAATSQDFMAWTCGPRLEPMYLLYVLRAMKQEFSRLVMGSTHKTIYMPDIERLAIPLPPLEEQRAIVRYVDAELAQLDALVQRKHRLAALLREREAAVVFALATRGMRTNPALIDSDAPYLPQVRDDWKVVLLRRLRCRVQTGPFGSQLSADEYIDGGWPIINPAHLVNGKIVPDPRVSVSEATRARLARHILREGDIVFARRGDVGRAAIVTSAEDGWLCGTGSLRVRLLDDDLDLGYLRHYLRLPILRQYFELMSVGSTMDNLNSDIVLGMPVVVPSREEQIQIAAACDDVAADTSRRVEVLERQLRLLAERRDVLILNAVKGGVELLTLENQ